MKKFASMALALVLVCLMSVAAFAQGTNYATQKWSATMGGTLKKQSDGTFAFSKCTQPYMSPTVEIFKDMTQMMGDNEEIEVVFAFDVKVKFIEGEEDGATSFRPMVRATSVSSKSALAATPDEWVEAYEEYMDGEEHFITDIAGNLYCNGLSEGKVEAYDTEWTHYESTELISKKELSKDWFTSWKFCFDNISDHEIIDTIYLKDFGIYLASEYETPATPTPEPTPEPTATPVPTEAPAVTDAPTAEATEAPADEKKGCGSVLALGLLAAVIPAMIVARKKEN